MGIGDMAGNGLGIGFLGCLGKRVQGDLAWDLRGFERGFL